MLRFRYIITELFWREICLIISQCVASCFVHNHRGHKQAYIITTAREAQFEGALQLVSINATPISTFAVLRNFGRLATMRFGFIFNYDLKQLIRACDIIISLCSVRRYVGVSQCGT